MFPDHGDFPVRASYTVNESPAPKSANVPRGTWIKHVRSTSPPNADFFHRSPDTAADTCRSTVPSLTRTDSGPRIRNPATTRSAGSTTRSATSRPSTDPTPHPDTSPTHDAASHAAHSSHPEPPGGTHPRGSPANQAHEHL